MDSILNGFNASEKIRAIMVTRKITQADLAELLDVTPETISNRLEADKWDYKDLNKLAAKYGVNPQDLI